MIHSTYIHQHYTPYDHMTTYLRLISMTSNNLVVERCHENENNKKLFAC